jgi:hypothetical protein
MGSNGIEVHVAAYEKLRSHVLAGSLGNHFGLVLLRREGIASWLNRETTCIAASNSTSSSGTTALPKLDENHVAVVRVLASMVMANRKESLS